jgi:Arc/MetJ family transcription regulator
MRTTLTLDADVAAKLRARARELGLPFKQAVNEALRRGLGAGTGRKPYRMPARAMGARPGVDPDKALALAAGFEDAAVVAAALSC